jgi:hypothetical protein
MRGRGWSDDERADEDEYFADLSSWEDLGSEGSGGDSDEDSDTSKAAVGSCGEEIRRGPFEEGYLGDIDNTSDSWEEPGR